MANASDAKRAGSSGFAHSADPAKHGWRSIQRLEAGLTNERLRKKKPFAPARQTELARPEGPMII
jgi:hypothetical protein